MEAGDQIYLRVRGNNYCKLNNITFNVDIGVRSNAEHSHTYTYSAYNSLRHKINCFCGYTSTQSHAVRSGSNICIQCGETVKAGIVEIQTLTKIKVSKNGSYRLSSGIIVLNDNDIEDYLNGIEIFEDIYLLI